MSVVMRAEIAEQPSIIAATLLQVDAFSEKLGNIKGKKFTRILFIARGTSDNVAAYGQFLIPVVAGLEAYSISPSLLNNYEVNLDFSGTLVFAISQSGETQEIVTAAHRVREMGGTLISITNNLDSSLEKLSDLCLVTPAGPEVAVPATKTYSSALVGLAAIVAEIFGVDALRRMLEKVPSIMSEQISSTEFDSRIIQLLAKSSTSVFAGRGMTLGATFEAALKLKETCAINVIGTSVADFVHGPIAALTDSVPLVIFSGDRKSPIYPGLQDLQRRASQTGGPVVTFGDFLEADKLELHVEVSGLEGLELIAPIMLAVPSQLLAAAVSDAKGLNADAPKVLSKVTQTS